MLSYLATNRLYKTKCLYLSSTRPNESRLFLEALAELQLKKPAVKPLIKLMADDSQRLYEIVLYDELTKEYASEDCILQVFTYMASKQAQELELSSGYYLVNLVVYQDELQEVPERCFLSLEVLLDGNLNFFIRNTKSLVSLACEVSVWSSQLKELKVVRSANENLLTNLTSMKASSISFEQYGEIFKILNGRSYLEYSKMFEAKTVKLT